MSNYKLAWFDLNKYENCKNLDAAGWAVEIGRRLEIELCMLPQNSHVKHGALDLIEDIKKYGLYTSKSENIEKELTTFRSLNKQKKFINDFTVYEALEFTDGYENKNEFEFDLRVMDDLDFSQEAREKWNNLTKKYSKPLSQEYKDRYDRWDKLEGNSFFNNDSGIRYLTIDINTTSEMLLTQFEVWLSDQKENYDLNFPDKNFKKSHFADWSKNKLLPYWDTLNFAKYDNVNITYDAIGRLLFPSEYDVTISERVRKVIKPKALNLFRFEIQEALLAQAEVE